METFFSVASTVLLSFTYPSDLANDIFYGQKFDSDHHYVKVAKVYCRDKKEGISKKKFIETATAESYRTSYTNEVHQAQGQILLASIEAADKTLCPGRRPIRISFPSIKLF